MESLFEKLESGLDKYRGDYASYYEACKHPNSPAMRDPKGWEYQPPQFQERWYWGGVIYWTVREGQGQIGWPGMPYNLSGE